MLRTFRAKPALMRFSLLGATAALGACNSNHGCVGPVNCPGTLGLGVNTQSLTFSAFGTSAQQTVTITLPPQQNGAPTESDNCMQGATRIVNVSSPTQPQNSTSTVIVTPLANGSCVLKLAGNPGVPGNSVSVSVAAP